MNAIRTDNKLIIISGCGGAGKYTTGQLLAEALEPSAWIVSDSLGRVAPWAYEQKLLSLTVENAAALVGNFFRAGYWQVVLTGGVPTQKELDSLLARIPADCRVLYIWLDVDKPRRDKRRIGRARDGADKAEFLDFVDSVVTDPGELEIPNGQYFRLQIDGETPHEVLERVVKEIAEEGLMLKSK